METTVDERKKTKTQLIGELAVLRQQIEQMVCSGFLESLLYVQKDRDRRKDGSTCFVDVAGNVINDLDDSPASVVSHKRLVLFIFFLRERGSVQPG